MSDNIQLILNLLGEDARLITYRPRLAAFLRSATAAILLQQIIYWYVKNGQQPFYKFKEPCDHAEYHDGDSWTEELAFGRSEFDTALRKIGCKLTAGKTRKDFRQALVWYWTDNQRRTFYDINLALLCKVGIRLYESKVGIPLYKVKSESDVIYTTADDPEMNTETPEIAPALPDAAPAPEIEKVESLPIAAETPLLLTSGQSEPPPSKVPEKVSPVRPVQPHVDLINKWAAAHPGGAPATGSLYGGERGKTAVALVKGGITPQQVFDYVRELKRGDPARGIAPDPFFKGKMVSLPYVAKNIREWLASRQQGDEPDEDWKTADPFLKQPNHREGYLAHNTFPLPPAKPK